MMGKIVNLNCKFPNWQSVRRIKVESIPKSNRLFFHDLLAHSFVYSKTTIFHTRTHTHNLTHSLGRIFVFARQLFNTLCHYRCHCMLDSYPCALELQLNNIQPKNRAATHMYDQQLDRRLSKPSSPCVCTTFREAIIQLSLYMCACTR